MSEHLIPFGKYKDKPVEVLRSDPDYTNWLAGQEWFRSQHKGLFTLIVNNFGEPHETPEHNRLQGLFLNQSFCITFARFVEPRLFQEEYTDTIYQIYGREVDYLIKADTIESIDVHNLKIEEKGIDISFDVSVLFKNKFTRKKNEDEWTKHSDPHYVSSRDYKIEIKPSVGDDYPAVLRQMKATGCNYLFVRDYTGDGLDREQFIQLFESQNIRVVFASYIG